MPIEDSLLDAPGLIKDIKYNPIACLSQNFLVAALGSKAFLLHKKTSRAMTLPLGGCGAITSVGVC